MTDQFSKTETLRRLRVVAKQARSALLIPTNRRVEVGTRTASVHAVAVPARDELFGDGDDLDSHWLLDEAASLDEVREHGYVAHLYFTDADPRGWGELEHVVVGWLGTPEHEARLVLTDEARVNDRLYPTEENAR